MTEWLSTFSDALSGPLWPASLAAIAWGFISIWLSPCHLAGIPLAVGYIAGTGPTQTSRTTLISAFAVGSLLSLVPLGIITIALGRLAGDLGLSSNLLVGGICLFSGLYLLDWLPSWPELKLPQPNSRKATAALVLGMLFGLALGPCAFAWIAPVLGVAWMQAANGLTAPILLLSGFALGHCLGIVLAATSLASVQTWLDAYGKYRGLAFGKAGCGVLLLMAAAYLLLASYR